MKVLNFGALNYDYVYEVPYIVHPGETLSASFMQRFLGGKGFNQSIALRRAGIPVFHAGAVGPDGDFLLEALCENDVDTQYITRGEVPTGQAIIQLSTEGQNAIILFGGSNRRITSEQIDNTLRRFSKGDMILLQNEINHIDYIINQAYNKGLYICLNPSPYDSTLLDGLGKVSLLFVNEIEGMQITAEKEPDLILKQLSERYPNMGVVLTLGQEGAIYKKGNVSYRHGAYNVPVVDTTAAGDTFTGHFIGAMLRHKSISEALELASKASALSISTKGAYPSIPTLEKVECSKLKFRN